MSKPLPSVSISTSPIAGATHRHQTLAPPLWPACAGSPDSLPAPRLRPDVVPDDCCSSTLSTNLSFGAPSAVTDRRSVRVVLPVPLVVLSIDTVAV